MDESAGLEGVIESTLRAHGVPLGKAKDILEKVKSSYSQFSVDLNDKDAERFLVTFKQVLYFAILPTRLRFRIMSPRNLRRGLG